MKNALARWWQWSMGPGWVRKAVGFGAPLLVGVAILGAFTPSEDSQQEGAVVAESPTAAVAPDVEMAVVQSITDGDTVRLADGRALRYIGIDTPETVAPGQPVQCFGAEASRRNGELVLGKTVRLEKDKNETDQFERLLRYVYLEDGTMVNEVLVAEGYAESVAYPPDTKHQTKLDAAEAAAKAERRGRWTACVATPVPTTPPVVLATQPAATVDQCPQGCTAQIAGCAIKGNISSSGEKIFHAPGQRDYEATVIDPSRGERYFCTGAEAIANGWRQAQR